MGVITLPANVEQDRQNGIKANSVHVQGNFDALLAAVNKKLEYDGSILPIADLPMNNHKLTGVATPTASGDAATKGYEGGNACMLAASQTVTGDKDFTGTITAVTQSTTDNSTKIATTAFVVDVLEAIYPVGSVYIGTQNTCPMGAFFGTWTLVSSGKALWTGNGTNANTTIAAGLPNITGKLGKFATASDTATGAFTKNNDNEKHGDAGSALNYYSYNFSAQKSNPIYGNSTTVQPPAYVVNVWRRTA